MVCWRGLRRKIPILLTVLAVLAVAWVARRWRAEHAATFQGIHARDWALNFHPGFNPGKSNLTYLAFSTMGSNAVPPLQAMLKDREPWYSILLTASGRWLPATTRNYLFQKLRPGRSGLHRIVAARALGAVGTNAIAAVPDLVAALGDNDARWAAAQALANIGGPALLALTAATTNQDVNIRHAAVYGLGQAGTNAWAAAPALLDRVRDTNESVRASALYSLGRVGQGGVPAVLEEFSSDDPARVRASVQAIKAMNQPPRQVLRTLLEFSTNASPELRRNSLEALQTLRLNHPRVVATYLQAVADSNALVRASAIRALGQANVWTTNATLGEFTLRLLGRTGSLEGRVQTALSQSLADPDESVRLAAEQSLNRLRASPTP